MADEEPGTDEIDLKDLLRSVFAIKTRVIVALLMVTVGFWSLQMLMNFANIRPYLILVFLTVLIIVPAVMIRNAMRTDDEEA